MQKKFQTKTFRAKEAFFHFFTKIERMSATTEEAECFSEDSLEVPLDKQKPKKKKKPKITVERKVKKTYLELYHKRNMKSVPKCTLY